MTDVSNRNRVKPGTDGAGRFAEEQKSPSGVTLTAPDTDTVEFEHDGHIYRATPTGGYRGGVDISIAPTDDPTDEEVVKVFFSDEADVANAATDPERIVSAVREHRRAERLGAMQTDLKRVAAAEMRDHVLSIAHRVGVTEADLADAHSVALHVGVGEPSTIDLWDSQAVFKQVDVPRATFTESEIWTLRNYERIGIHNGRETTGTNHNTGGPWLSIDMRPPHPAPAHL